jgi:hypothetical protein
MRDPKTVAHEIFPRFRLFGKLVRLPHLITIWHVDPETDGTDNSCDWFGTKLSEANGWYQGDLDDMKWMSDDTRKAIKYIWYKFHHVLAPRPWYKHPKWHVHHWQVQIIPLQRCKRWVFSRCVLCGGRFS